MARWIAVMALATTFGLCAAASAEPARHACDAIGEEGWRVVATNEIAAVKDGKPVPNGTHFVLADHRDGKLYRYFVMQKGDGFDADYDDRRRTGNWQFQWFWPDKTVNLNENTARCQSCHRGQAGSEYLYTGYRLPRFSGTPIE